VQPSLSEVAANAVMEASASGLAVIATGVGEIPSIIDNGHTGILVKAKDVDSLTKALSSLLDDISLARDMGRAGRSRVDERYSWGVINKRIEECYSNVIKNY
jgi:glycosyltransferase involved in cell wall biosynthesis